jgi:hypothetical protein
MIAAIISVAVGACGSAATHSSLDPAAVVPANAPIYVTAKVPDSGQLGVFRQIVTDFAGARAWTKLSDGFNRSLARKHLSWSQDVAPWIGDEVGLAFNQIPSLADVSSTNPADSGDPNVVLIFPTNDMTAALAFARRMDKTGSDGFTAERDGSDMLVGQPATLATFTAYTGSMLNSEAGYTRLRERAAGADLSVLFNAHALLSTIAESQTKLSAGTSQLKSQTALALAKLKMIPADATLGVGLGAGAHAITLDVVPYDLPASVTGTGASGATVAGLPGDSILALALNLTTPANSPLVKAFTDGFGLAEGVTGTSGTFSGSLPGTGSHHILPTQALNVSPGDVGQISDRLDAILKNILPALGPLELSVGGSSLLGLHGGLSLTSADPTAAAGLLSSLLTRLKHSGSVQASGTAKDFTVAAGPYDIHVSDELGKVLALIGDTSASELLHPAAALSADPAYASAVSRLPAGAKVPVYFSFSGLNTLLGLFSSGKVAQAEKVLGKLSYLIEGSTPGDTRLVLGLR